MCAKFSLFQRFMDQSFNSAVTLFFSRLIKHLVPTTGIKKSKTQPGNFGASFAILFSTFRGNFKSLPHFENHSMNCPLCADPQSHYPLATHPNCL